QLQPATSTDDITTRFFYNARGQEVGSLDGDGYLTETKYDLAGNKTSVVKYANPAKPYTPGATLASIEPLASAADQTQTFGFDALNREISMTGVDGTQMQNVYDNVGDLVSTTVAAGTADVRTELSKYDLQGHLIARLSPQGASLLNGNAAHDAAIWSAYGTTYQYD